jgi:hypothetical protein
MYQKACKYIKFKTLTSRYKRKIIKNLDLTKLFFNLAKYSLQIDKNKYNLGVSL